MKNGTIPPVLDKTSAQWYEDSQETPTYPTEEVGRRYVAKPGQKLRARAWPVSPLYPDYPYAISSGSQTRRFEALTYHPVVRACLDFRVRGAFMAPFELVDPNEGNYLRHPEYRALFEEHKRWILNQIANYAEYGHQTIKDMAKGLLWNGMTNGYNIPEAVFTQRGYMTEVEEIVIFDPARFDIYINQTGQVEGFRYSVDGSWHGGDEMGKYAVCPYPTLRNANWYGQSLLQPIARDIDLLDIVEESAVRSIQALSVRPIIHQVPPEAKDDDVEDIHNALVNTGSNGVITIPMLERGVTAGGDETILETQKITVLEDRASGEGMDAIEFLLNYYPTRITRALGVPDDLGLTTTDAGSYAKSQTEDSAVVHPVHAQDRDYVINFFNVYVIPWMIKSNDRFLPPGYRLPRFRRSDERRQGTPIELEPDERHAIE